MTVLLSSHILAEVQQVCTSATIIGNGRLLASGRVDDLLGDDVVPTGSASPTRQGAGVLDAAGFTVSPTSATTWSSRAEPPRGGHPGRSPRAGIWRPGADGRPPDLETFFLKLTAGETHGRERGRPMRPRDGLLGVELTRLRWRRAVALLVWPPCWLPRVIFACHSVEHPPVYRGRPQHAAAQADARVSARSMRKQVRACAPTPRTFWAPMPRPADCERAGAPAERYYPRQPLDLAAVLTSRAWATSLIVLTVLLVLAGTTFAGAGLEHRAR